jgi:hypothetical protein
LSTPFDDIDTKKWQKLGPTDSAVPGADWPTARTTSTLVAFKDKLYVFGGIGDLKAKNDIPEAYQMWIYHISESRWQRLDCSDEFSCPTSMTFNVVVMNDLFWTSYGSELWHMDPETNRWFFHGKIPVAPEKAQPTLLLPDYSRGTLIVLSQVATDNAIKSAAFVEYSIGAHAT